jgi:hypothetical protein
LETIQQHSQEQIQKHIVAQENPQNKVNHSEDLIIEGIQGRVEQNGPIFSKIKF